jgi:aminoglycoside 2'-N-acetyltransferase I
LRSALGNARAKVHDRRYVYKPGKRLTMAPELVFDVTPAGLLTPDQRAEIIDLCSIAYEEDFGHLFHELVQSVHVRACLNGELVSHAAWVTRWLQPNGGRPLRTAYVEAVATSPRHQHNGYATAVMRALQARIADYELGGLSPFDVAYYERLGWELWRGPLAIRTEGGLLPTPDETAMILRMAYTPPLDLDAQLTAEWRRGELW